MPSGTWKYDEELGQCVQVSDRIPKLSRFTVAGSRPFCSRRGEMIDLGNGPEFVRDATEKRELMKRHGVMEAQGDIPRKAPKRMPSFSEHFRKETGTPLSEAGGLVHVQGR